MEDCGKHIGTLDPWSADDLAPFERSQAGGHDIVCRHARYGTKVEPLTLMEFGRHYARTERLYSQPLRLQLLVQRLRQRHEVGQRSHVHGPARRCRPRKHRRSDDLHVKQLARFVSGQVDERHVVADARVVDERGEFLARAHVGDGLTTVRSTRLYSI